MIEIIVAAAVTVAAGILVYNSINKGESGRSPENIQPAAPGQSTAVPLSQRDETGPMVYYANDTHGSRDREYRFNYKKVNGTWRAYIIRMPSLGNRDATSIPTHRLWDDNNNAYICWDNEVYSLKDMQNISRVWADSIQEYIATGKRFGPQ